MNSKSFIRRLEKEGWVRARQKGSHVTLNHPNGAGLITASHPKKDLPTGTLRSIFRIAGWDWPL